MPHPIRLIHFSPGTATGRHDSHRACLALGWFLSEAALETGCSQPWELCWAMPTIHSREAIQNLLSRAAVLVIATPTYAQGSPWYVRRFFELSAGLAAWGTPATAFATSGGLHTGGEQAVADTLRSLQGLGAATFSFAQKQLVLGTGQKFTPDGTFDLIDTWFLRQFARTILLHAVLRSAPDDADLWADRLDLTTDYYRRFPPEVALESSLGRIRDLLNAPLQDPTAWTQWSSLLGRDASPPDPSTLPHPELLPRPPGEGG